MDAVGTAVMRAEQVEYSYPGGIKVFADLNVELREGEVLSLIGPSGCGKSTLLRLVAGLLRPDHGSIRLRDAGDDSRHRLTMLFQQDTVLPWMNVEDNVSLYFKFNRGKMPPAEQRARIDELLVMVGLQDFRKAFPRQLSGGMRRRLALLTAVAPRPRILLLDEPFSSVDEPTRIGIHQDVLNIVRELRISVILVTHDLAEAITVGDRVALMSFRPATVVNTYEVPFGQQRNVRETRTRPEYSALYTTIWEDLNEQSPGLNPDRLAEADKT